MRNSLAGIALAVVLVAALFAAAHFGSRPGVESDAVRFSDPAKAAAEIKQDFLGTKLIGAWTLNCTTQRALPRAPQTGNSTGTPPREGPPLGWELPHCHTFQAVKTPQNSSEVRATFRRVGFKNVLTAFLRFPPQEVESGDATTLQLDKIAIPMPVGGCTATFCLSILSVKHVKEPELLASKRMKLTYISRRSGKSVTLNYSMIGFSQAVGTMRRLDK